MIQSEKSLFVCASVLGGWQTEIKATGDVFGPVFNKINDLWVWQKTHLYNDKKSY